MKSSSGAHFISIDHIRAIAALLVFVWHFTHGVAGTPVPFNVAPGLLSIFDEGHVGVALFMTLSGYLFAKLLDGRSVKFLPFLWNRMLRLFPLLLFVLVINLLLILLSQIVFTGPRSFYWSLSQLKLGPAAVYLERLPLGIILPLWPNGGWSITAELHFYVLLPALLFIRNRVPTALTLILVLTVAFRWFLYVKNGEVQSVAYWTIVGRLDQFVLGIVAYHIRLIFTDRHYLIGIIFSTFLYFYWWFDANGGFYHFQGYPSKSAIWIIMPLIEGLTFASMIAWYETSFAGAERAWSTLLGRIGEYSFSIYLLHFFFVFKISDWVNHNIIDISEFYLAFPVAIIAFMVMVPIGFISMKFIEAPFLRYRIPYLVESRTEAAKTFGRT